MNKLWTIDELRIIAADQIEKNGKLHLRIDELERELLHMTGLHAAHEITVFWQRDRIKELEQLLAECEAGLFTEILAGRLNAEAGL